MPGRVEGKVAFVTGAARGQGRSHALRLAEEGADIIAVDLCDRVETIAMYPPASEEDLAETVRQVEELDRRIVATKADVRDSAALAAALADGVAQLGRLDIVCANAGVNDISPALDVTDASWRDIIDINLTGVWNTCKAALPHLIASGGGSIVITSSAAGIKGAANIVHYTASKHGAVGIMRSLANEFAPLNIRCNTVHPGTVDTVMLQNEKTWEVFLAGAGKPTQEAAARAFTATNALPVPWLEATDISNAVLWLASDEARYVTGVMLPVDAGFTIK
jgi:SDR family mycofactocin-dependent oxidoreductase